MESHLVAAPAVNWHEGAEKARYLLNLFAATLACGRSPKTEADRCRARSLRAARPRMLAVMQQGARLRLANRVESLAIMLKSGQPLEAANPVGVGGTSSLRLEASAAMGHLPRQR